MQRLRLVPLTICALLAFTVPAAAQSGTGSTLSQSAPFTTASTTTAAATTPAPSASTPAAVTTTTTQAVATTAPAGLPQTGDNLPLEVGAGVVLVGIGVALRFRRGWR